MANHRIEIFIGNCPLCKETVQLIQALADSTCEVLIYNLQKRMDKAQQYGVRAVPAVAVNGRLVLIGKPSRSQLEASGVILPDRSAQVPNYMGLGI